MNSEVEQFFEPLWQDYLLHCPSAEKIHALLGGGRPIINDHIALRTFNTSNLGLAALEGRFLALGYREAGQYDFKAKKLRAKHFEHANPAVPKIFISELLLEQFSPELNRLVQSLLTQMDSSQTGRSDFFSSGRHWEVSEGAYRQLLIESEYAAWLAAFGFRANHFTVNVNQLDGFDSVAQVNAALQAAGFALNESGGLVKGSPEVMLEQSAIMADRVKVAFSDSDQTIPACFYEFAFRYPLPDGSLYQGFVEASADKIFESTDSR